MTDHVFQFDIKAKAIMYINLSFMHVMKVRRRYTGARAILTSTLPSFPRCPFMNQLKRDGISRAVHFEIGVLFLQDTTDKTDTFAIGFCPLS